MGQYKTGTISVNNGETTVTGTGTNWQAANIREGCVIEIAGQEKLIASLTDTTHLELSVPWSGANQADIAYAIQYTSPDFGTNWGVSQQAIAILQALQSVAISAISALTPAADKLAYFTGAGSAALTDLTGLARTVLGKSTGSEMLIAMGAREVLTADRTYYVRPDGSDSNDGLSNTAGGAFQTIQKAVDTVTALDCSIYTPTINVAAGTYTENVTLSPIIGAARAVIVGDTTTPTNVVVQGNFNGVNCGNWQIKGFQVGGTNAYPLVFAGGATSIEAGYFDLSAITSANHIVVSNNAYFRLIGNYSISGQSTYAHMSVSYGGVVEMYSKTVTLAADVTFSVFTASNNGAINTGSMTYDLGAFTVTGQRYSASLAGVIRTGGGGASYFPGTTAGGTSTGGQYA